MYLERSLEKIIENGVTAIDMAHQTLSSSKVSESEKQQDITQCAVGALLNKVKCLTVQFTWIATTCCS